MSVSSNKSAHARSRGTLARSKALNTGLISGFSALLVLMAFLAIVSLFQMQHSQEHLRQIVDNHMSKIELTGRMQTAARERTLSLQRLIITEDPFERDEEWMRYNRLAQHFINARNALIRMQLTTKERELLAIQRELTNRAVPLQNHVVELVNAGDLDAAYQKLDTMALPAQNEVLSVLNELTQVQNHAASAVATEVAHIQRQARKIILVLSSLSLLTGLFIAIIVIRRVKNTTLESEYLATHDGLTGLPNRVLMLDRMEHELFRATRNKRLVGVMFLDLDRFKTINDTLGHSVGDMLLIAVAERLSKVVRASDTVARLGGDEFVIVLEDVENTDQIARLAEKIVSCMRKPLRTEHHELFTSTSIGISLFPSDGDNANELLKNADAAMYHAKENGKNNYQFYSTEMSDRAVTRLRFETGLRRALEKHEFTLLYQPIIAVDSAQLTGVEALIRWQSEDYGLVQPDDFIPLLEETSLIIPVGEWVLTQVCKQAQTWMHDLDLPEHFRISVNISSRQFTPGVLAPHIEDLIRMHKLPPKMLELEITESLLMHNEETALRTLERLRQSGVELAIDDFGTGYSSLSRLKHYPISRIKIDRSFMQEIVSQGSDETIVIAILALARGLGLSVVAEGIETAMQFQCLRKHGCAEAQGFLFSRPVSAQDMTALLSQPKTTIADH